MIRINNLTKCFSNEKIINNLNLEINDGEIMALVGKNGAGKTTLIRLISGLLKCDSGEILLNSNKNIGVLLGGNIQLFDNLTGFETIHFFGRLNGVPKDLINKRINDLNDILKFKSFINKKTGILSRGMKQKIGLAISIIHNPDIVLLDEPSTGLDIEACNDIITFIKYLKSRNKTILIATHNMFEISDLSDTIAFLCGGRITKKVSTQYIFKNCSNDMKIERLIEEMGGR